ncbi:hypothetical protein EUGRSUZ_F02526 [Eucalyptus grandis]|uniref:Uncharacterized protein n=2 Tax=Eucalyptus grandis TaxID=71139 RepID=A0ACC3KIY3_EUCGR|nr:hypothetical protein EUGRSUZ_F02526 [Eucalyptus grandis]
MTRQTMLLLLGYGSRSAMTSNIQLSKEDHEFWSWNIEVGLMNLVENPSFTKLYLSLTFEVRFLMFFLGQCLCNGTVITGRF